MLKCFSFLLRASSGKRTWWALETNTEEFYDSWLVVKKCKCVVHSASPFKEGRGESVRYSDALLIRIINSIATKRLFLPSMDVETGAMSSLLPKLRDLLSDKYNLQKAVRRQARSVSAELDSIYAFLRRVTDAPPEMADKHARTWARQMREASYDIDDIIETALMSADGCSEPIDANGWLKRATKKMSNLPNKRRARGDILVAIEDIKNLLIEISQRLVRYRFYPSVVRPVTATSTTVDPRLPALYRNERELVGIEEAREELVRLLTKGDTEDDKIRELKIVSILGLAGVGKTTLAKAVYNRLQAQFDCSAFVSVSPKPDLEKVFTDILLQLDEEKYHMGITAKRDMDLNQFINQIREFLENKRYVRITGSMLLTIASCRIYNQVAIM